jgi:cytoskeleton protein RodZ
LSHQKRAVLIKANPPLTGKIIPAKVPAKEGKIEVKIETIGRSWLSVTSGAKELYSETLEPGIKLRFVGKEIKVKAGNGGAVKVYVDGNSLGLMGQEGVVSERTYRASE